MKHEFISDFDDETKNEIKEQLGTSELKRYNIFGILYTDDITLYIISTPGPLWPLYIIADYNGHRYGLFGGNMHMYVPDQRWWWYITRIDTAYAERKEIRDMLHLVCNYACYMKDQNDTDYSVTIASKGYDQLLINITDKNAYGIRLF